MCKKIVVKEARKPLQIMSVEDGCRETCVKEYFDNPEQLVFVPLNVTDTLCIIVNNSNTKGLSENFLYPTQKEFEPVTRAMGTALFVHSRWIEKEGKKTTELVDITDDDLFFIQCFLDEFYQSNLRHKYYKAATR